jgi:pyocin large subunit-like protein
MTTTRKFIIGLATGMLLWLISGRFRDAPTSDYVLVKSKSAALERSSPARDARPDDAPATSATASKGFRDQARLDEHFEKHGAEFPGLNKREYLAKAQKLRDAPASESILEIVRPSDAVVSRYDKSSGAFIAFDKDGTIRTFFRPNDGEAYFRRQARRSPER